MTDDFTLNANFGVFPEKRYIIVLQAEGRGFGSYEFQATVDPIIEIDPNQLIDVDGFLRPATEVYSLSFSDGISMPSDTAPIPEPSSIVLFIVGIAGCFFFQYRRPIKRQ